MVWIVLGHTMMMPAPLNGFDNPEDLVASFGARSKVWFMTVIGGQIAVDSFFFLGGFLIAYLGVRDLRRGAGRYRTALWFCTDTSESPRLSRLRWCSIRRLCPGSAMDRSS